MKASVKDGMIRTPIRLRVKEIYKGKNIYFQFERAFQKTEECDKTVLLAVSYNSYIVRANNGSFQNEQ